ncbi:soleucyl-trna synthetase [Holotrichia oblita]|nr:soleucyl-trna synthetase [Holotrichia oblita]
MYKKVSTALNFVDREKEVLEFWDKNSIFQKSMDLREGSPVFSFYDGPPTANGMPHIGHVLTRAVKDIIPRYKTMKGYQVPRKAGWDTHGLPVELEVEKQLGINGKPEIEKYGIEPFIKKCKESVWKYENEWKNMSKRVGYWADMENPYVTYHNPYIESVWWAIKSIFDKGLIYKGHKVVPYCPRCGTALSTHEVAQGYKDVKEKSIFVRFKVVGTENDYFMAWTTTPWTLPSNVGLTVNAHEDYAKVEYKGDYYYVAKALAESVFKSGYTILETRKGAELEGMSYEPLFDYVKTDKKGFYILCDDYVTLTDGSGIVHTAPAFGEDDARVGRKYDLPFVQLVDEQGLFVDAVTDFAGMFVKDADAHIIKKLKENGKLFSTLDYEHSYPFCWRCDTPLLYYARSTWFIKMTEIKDRLLANNDTVNWIPENVKHGRFGKWLENVLDWGLSRERFWGTPLPIWECECGHLHAIGSIEELRALGRDGVSKDIELHKPYIDKITIDCPQCGGKMTRVAEVIDCWFDSGAMPFAQWHYPFERKDIFEQNFPANFISEAVDQTRGWFYTLHAISCLLFDKAAFENVIVLGHVQDKDGQKMSKHKGNVVDPNEFLDKQGGRRKMVFLFKRRPMASKQIFGGRG